MHVCELTKDWLREALKEQINMGLDPGVVTQAVLD